MKKYLAFLILIALIGLPGALSERQVDMQIGYDFGSANNTNVQAAGEIGPAKTGSADSGAAWSESPLSLSGQDQAITSGLQTGTEASLTSTRSLKLPLMQPSSQSTSLQKFSEYYHPAAEAHGDQLTAPSEIDLKDMEPTTLYFGAMQKAVPYSQYKTYALSTNTNSLWILGSSSWTQYAVVPLGSVLNMITLSPGGGYGYLYEIYPDGSLDKNSYYFYPYNQIEFYADEVGEHQLFYNIAGQPSNVVVIYVAADQQPPQPVYNYAAITISSSWLRGYNVYVDGNYRETEGMTGDPDGIVTINVPGDQYHNIAIDSNGFTFSDYKYFKAGYAYQLNI